jgi:hypothetical protein
MQNIIVNKNLVVAKKLLEIINKKQNRSRDNNLITLKLEDISGLSSEEIIESLENLENMEIVTFEDGEDKYDDNVRYIELYYNKNKLKEFIKTMEDEFYKVETTYKTKKELKHLLKALALILRFKDSEKPINFTELGSEYWDVIIWIANHSGSLKIIYKDEPDVEWKDLKRSHIIGISQVPDKFIITYPFILTKLDDKIRELLIAPQLERIGLFLKNNKEGLEWRCANCGHYFGVILKDKKQIADYLNDFSADKFMVCKKCRKRNYFSIDQKGGIKFLITKKKMFFEKETEEEKKKKFKQLLNAVNKDHIQDREQ